jgi:sigma-B regulation protein RsbU (phosphoserine phosphatase)
MKVLIAEDDEVSRIVLSRMLQKWGHEVVATVDGRSAYEILETEDAPSVAILDWMMPEMDGLEVCRQLRQLNLAEPPYLILLTARDQTDDIVAGLDSGANDYVVKPYDWRELKSRLRVGERMVALQRDLAGRIRELQYAMAKIHELQELIPICSYCKKVRDDRNYWEQVESYISTRTGVQFSHGVCPQCYTKVIAQLERAGATADV